MGSSIAEHVAVNSTWIFSVICEDRGHFSVVTRLVDSALVRTYPWLADTLQDCRRWSGPDQTSSWYECKHASKGDLRPMEIDGVVIKQHGHLGGSPIAPEASMWRKALLSLLHRREALHLVVLVRDLDGRPERREGIQQVREGYRWPFHVVAAAAQPEIEAWLVTGFTPQNESEARRLQERRNLLSFDPTLESHRLTSRPNDALTDAKRVLSALCNDDSKRIEQCLADQALLTQRGAENGAAAFLDEVNEVVASLMRGRDRDA